MYFPKAREIYIMPSRAMNENNWDKHPWESVRMAAGPTSFLQADPAWIRGPRKSPLGAGQGQRLSSLPQWNDLREY